MMLPCSVAFEALGTGWEIDTPEEVGDVLMEKIRGRIDAFDVVYSRFRDDSLVRQLAVSPGEYTFPSDVLRLISFYRRLYDITNGLFTPLVGSMLERAGYDAGYTFQAREQIPLLSWDEGMRWRGATVTTDRPITIDVGAAGKGYLVDIICGMLHAAGIKEYVVDASGDLRHKGTRENRVGLEHPLDAGKVIGVADVKNASLCASAVNRRFWGNGMHHIFNPYARQPAQDVLATWVIAEDAMVADGLATALFLSHPEKLTGHFKFEYVRMLRCGAVDYSHDFEGEIYS